MERVNVIFLIWDACRLDIARRHAKTLRALADENIWFDNAITPAGHSLASHVSLFTGDYPHEHGVFRQGQQIDSQPLLANLGEQNYTRYGISANGFASSMYRFDSGFDRFYNTQGQMVYPEGLDIHKYAREISTDGQLTKLGELTKFFNSIVNHDHRLKSFANIASAGLTELVRRYDSLERLPHPRFNSLSEFNYSPEKNTNIIESIIRRESDSEQPFFVFANYMDTHRPYTPPANIQRGQCGHTFSYRELVELSELAYPWGYIERVRKGNDLDATTLEQIQCLYAGEVVSVDQHLKRIINTLEKVGLREDTLIVVTADHGENLGEENLMGEKRMGHEGSASEHHLRVPLVIAHPELEGRTVESYVSTKNIHTLLSEGLDPFIKSAGTDIHSLTPEDGIVASQIPTHNTEIIKERHPSLADIVERDLSVTYTNDWKIVISSTGDKYAWYQEQERDIETAPNDAVETCRSNLQNLLDKARRDVKLDQADQSHLEALGYL